MDAHQNQARHHLHRIQNPLTPPRKRRCPPTAVARHGAAALAAESPPEAGAARRLKSPRRTRPLVIKKKRHLRPPLPFAPQRHQCHHRPSPKPCLSLSVCVRAFAQTPPSRQPPPPPKNTPRHGSYRERGSLTRVSRSAASENAVARHGAAALAAESPPEAGAARRLKSPRRTRPSLIKTKRHHHPTLPARSRILLECGGRARNERRHRFRRCSNLPLTRISRRCESGVAGRALCWAPTAPARQSDAPPQHRTLTFAAASSPPVRRLSSLPATGRRL
jgi:hypothetical protein